MAQTARQSVKQPLIFPQEEYHRSIMDYRTSRENGSDIHPLPNLPNIGSIMSVDNESENGVWKQHIRDSQPKSSFIEVESQQ